MANILVVDDELGIRDLLQEILDDEGHVVEVAENASQAREARNRAEPDLVLLDIWMPDTDGISLLKEWSSGGQLTMPVIMMSGHATIDTAVEATKIGAQTFLEKPITLKKLLQAVNETLNRAAVAKQLAAEAEASRRVREGKTAVAEDPLQSPNLTVEQAMMGGQSFADSVVPLGPDPVQSFDLSIPLREARDKFERTYFEYHLAQEGGSMTRVAEKTGLERTHLYRKLKQLGVDLSSRKKKKRSG